MGALTEHKSNVLTILVKGFLTVQNMCIMKMGHWLFAEHNKKYIIKTCLPRPNSWNW